MVAVSTEFRQFGKSGIHLMKDVLYFFEKYHKIEPENENTLQKSISRLLYCYEMKLKLADIQV